MKPKELPKFIADQNNYVKSRKARSKKSDEDKPSYKPVIDKNSNDIIRKNPRDKPTYERLYCSARKPINIEEVKVKQYPKDSINRGLKLYQIALKKKEENKEEPLIKEKIPLQKNSLVTNGFKKELNRIIKENDLEDKDDVNYEDMKKIFKGLRSIPTNSEPSDEMVKLVEKFWNDINSKGMPKVSINLLKEYIGAILSINLPIQKPQLNAKEISHITTIYNLFIYNRNSSKPIKLSNVSSDALSGSNFNQQLKEKTNTFTKDIKSHRSLVKFADEMVMKKQEQERY